MSGCGDLFKDAEALATSGARCLERAEARGDLSLRVTGMFYLCHADHALGRFAEGARQALELLDLLDGPPAQERFGLPVLPYSGACALGAECLSQLGDQGGAFPLLEKGRDVADAVGHLYSQMALAAAHGGVLVTVGRADQAIPLLEATARTCREKHFIGQLINALRHHGRAYVAAGRPADAIAPEEESIELQESAQVYVNRGLQHTALATAWLALGDLEKAERASAAALDFANRFAERGVEGWARLVAAEIALARGDRSAAEQSVDEAQEIAEELGMMPLVEACRALVRNLP